MSTLSRLLTGRARSVSSFRTVTGADSIASSDLNNEIVFNSASAAVLTLPSGNGLNATIDDIIAVYIAGAGIPTLAWTGSTIRVPTGMPTPVQYSYMVVKWAPTNEWVRV